MIVASGPELAPDVWALAREIASRSGARALLALRPTGATGRAPALEPLEGVVVAHFQQLAATAADTGLPGAPPAASDVASYLHTGGTTGTPKLAARTHANEVANAWMIGSGLFDEGSVALAALPLFHTNALVVTVLEPLLRGHHVLWAGPLGYRDPALIANVWKIVERYRITAMSAVPTVYAVLARVPVDADISSLALPIVGAAPLPGAVREAFEAHTGVALCEGYGLTEGTCASARSRPDAPARVGPSVGQRLPYQEARTVAVDASGQWTFLEPGEIGTLVLRGPNIFAGYLVPGPSGPELQAGEKVRDGWLDTGDLASVDADGYIRLVGRAKDLIIRGGHNIDPATIEDALLEHPDVVAAAAVGRPDTHAGEVPVAFVTLRPGSDLDAGELRAWASAHVPERAAAPKAVAVVDAIPQTAVGKVYKPELRRRAAEAAAREALAATAVADRVRAVLLDGAPGDPRSAFRGRRRCPQGPIRVSLDLASDVERRSPRRPAGRAWVCSVAAPQSRKACDDSSPAAASELACIEHTPAGRARRAG